VGVEANHEYTGVRKDGGAKALRQRLKPPSSMSREWRRRRIADKQRLGQ